MRRNRTAQIRHAIDRGLDFIYRTACVPEHFEMYGYDFLCCFCCIASTSKDVALSRTARRMGRERAIHWRQHHAQITPDLDANDIAYLVFGSDAAERLGVGDEAFKSDLLSAAQRFSAVDYLGFDAVHEPPPSDIPDDCKCGAENKRGRKTCCRCKRQLPVFSTYAIWVDALIRSYTGERYGIKLGASFADVIKWLPTMRPYPAYDDEEIIDFYWAIYSVTHIVYALNEYSFYRLSPRSMPEEYAFLKSSFKHFVAMEDAESIGELMDTLKSFGLSEHHPLMIQGKDFLLAQQNADGSWGDLSADDVYGRYHPTWTAIDGLREYSWRGGVRRLDKRLRLLFKNYAR
jgi:hypothetical protein